MKPGTIVTGKMATALRDLGFDYVFDTDFAADLTIMEEGHEILGRLNKFLAGDKDVKLPVMTSCCPAWVNFYEHEFPDLLDYPSTAKSPAQMFGAVAKTYWAEKMGIPREKLVVVSIMPCLAKKYEAGREEFKVDGNPDVDYSISTRELGRLIKRANIDFVNLPDSDFDSPLGESTGAGAIFGITGGVMEAALRTVHAIVTGKEMPEDALEVKPILGLDKGIKEMTMDLNGKEVRIAVAHGIGHVQALLEKVREAEQKGEEPPYHFIEVMACNGGCVGGGGQPLGVTDEIRKARMEGLMKDDRGSKQRCSHLNPDVKKLYDEFLGKPLSERSHHLLHTSYQKRELYKK
jgi:NADH-quinone oxidoreductase subunit G/NADP-reducing hydrogenase subunit HndD